MAIRRTSTSGLSNRAIYIDGSAGTSKIVDIPDTPTIGTATAGAESATVTYTAALTGGTATTFTALSNPGSITGTGSSPITVSGLTAATAYTFTIKAGNTTGDSAYSSASNSVTAFSGSSYESIATFNGTGSSGTITFSSIPSTYKHLQLRFSLKGTSGSGGYPTSFNFYVNGDNSSANYYCHAFNGSGAAATVGAGANNSDFIYAPGSNVDSTNYAGGIIDILDYTNTNKNTTFRSLNGLDNNGSGYIRFTSLLWVNTAAITSISFVTDPTYLGSWTTASKIALYGIKG